MEASLFPLLEWPEHLPLLLEGLEATMTELGGSVDELELDLLEGDTVGLDEKRLAEGDEALLDTSDGALEHDVVLVDLTVVGEATKWCDALDGQVELGHRVLGVLDGTLGVAHAVGDLVDLLVHLGTVMVAVLTSTWHRVRHTRRMPGSNTGNLAQTLVGLTGKASHAPAGHNTLETLTLGNGHGVDHLVLIEHAADLHRLLEVVADEANLVSHAATVDLDLHEV